MEDKIRFLEKQARVLRRDVLNMIYQAGDGHPGPALSCADLVTALYFHVLRVDPEKPDWPLRDRFILSKGHACPVVYAALARRGFFPLETLPTLRSLGSILQGHPDMKKTPGIDSTSGSLGNGVAVGMGMALAGRVQQQDYFTYVITGDGELQEGIIWEAAMCAARYKVGKLIVFVDANGLQSGDKVAEISALSPIFAKWQAFGWHCQEIDGHNFAEILAAIEKAQEETECPSVIIAKTIKGKGVSFMEGDNSWHKRVPTAEELAQALQELGEEEA